MKENTLNPIRLGFFYLLVPFLIFCIGYLRAGYALIILVALTWLTVKFWNFSAEKMKSAFPPRADLLGGTLIILAWVLLSGIGGFAFQNPDFHGRNAIFRDLVQMDWPVFYSSVGGTNDYALAYYLGYWLPAALVGKIAGWTVANIALALWTIFGLILVGIFIRQLSGLSFTAGILLFIFFSGMDVIGVIFQQNAGLITYPGIWPPIQHLEWWNEFFQFSSFTTQLFWVFNQAIPVWVALGLIFHKRNINLMMVVFALSFFLAPLPAIGLSPILLTLVVQDFNAWRAKRVKHQGLKDWTLEIRDWVRCQVCPGCLLGSLLIIAVAFLFYATNTSVTEWQLFNLNGSSAVIFLLFTILEWLILWLLVFEKNKTQPWVYIIALTLLLTPLIRLSGLDIIGRRVTIPALFLLFLLVAQALRNKGYRHRAVLILILIIGAFTPLYEINRSLYRTTQWIFSPTKIKPETTISAEKRDLPPFPPYPEYDHPHSLAADHWISLANFHPDQLEDWVGKTENTFFFQYLARQP